MVRVGTRHLDSDESRREDTALIAEILAGSGSQEACRRLVSKYWRLLIAWIRPRVPDSSGAEDIAQEAFIRAFRALPQLADHQRFVPWLLRIAWNRAADQARLRRKDRSLDRLLEEGEAGGRLLAPEVDQGEEMDRAEGYQAILRAVDRLPDRYRMVIVLRYFEGMSGSEIAAALGEPEGTIRNRLFRAHDKVRRLMGRLPAALPPAATGERQ